MVLLRRPVRIYDMGQGLFVQKNGLDFWHSWWFCAALPFYLQHKFATIDSVYRIGSVYTSFPVYCFAAVQFVKQLYVCMIRSY